MEKVDVDELESRMGPGSVRASLTKPLGLANLGANHYELEPGESLAFGVHAHERQEEVFVVQAGAVTFETYPDREAAVAGAVDGDDRGEAVVVRAGEVARAAAGEYQRGRNEGEARARSCSRSAPRRTPVTSTCSASATPAGSARRTASSSRTTAAPSSRSARRAVARPRGTTDHHRASRGRVGARVGVRVGARVGDASAHESETGRRVRVTPRL